MTLPHSKCQRTISLLRPQTHQILQEDLYFSPTKKSETDHLSQNCWENPWVKTCLSNSLFPGMLTIDFALLVRSSEAAKCWYSIVLDVLIRCSFNTSCCWILQRHAKIEILAANVTLNLLLWFQAFGWLVSRLLIKWVLEVCWNRG